MCICFVNTPFVYRIYVIYLHPKIQLFIFITRGFWLIFSSSFIYLFIIVFFFGVFECFVCVCVHFFFVWCYIHTLIFVEILWLSNSPIEIIGGSRVVMVVFNVHLRLSVSVSRWFLIHNHIDISQHHGAYRSASINIIVATIAVSNEQWRLPIDITTVINTMTVIDR